MKLTTATLIIIAAIKWTLQTSQSYEDLNTANGYGMMQDETNSLDDNQKKVLEMLAEHSYSLSGAREFESILTKEKAIENFNVPFSENTTQASTHQETGQMPVVDNSMDCVAQLYQTEALYQQIEIDGEQYILTLQEWQQLYKIIRYQQQSNQANSSDVKMQFEESQPSTTGQPSQETVLIDNPNLYTSLAPQAMVQEPPKQTEKISMQYTSGVEGPLPSFNTLWEACKMAKLNRKSQSSYKNQERTTPYPIPNKTKVQSNSESTSSNKNSENIWSWIKNQVIQNKNVYTDFYTPEIYNEIFNSEKLRELTGYYNGFVKDLEEYMQKHMPRPKPEYIQQVGENRTICKYTLGDLYMKQELNSKSITDCKTKSEERYDHALLKNKAQTILNIPEIYQDLKYMPENTFTKTLLKVENSNGLTPIQVGLLEYLYRTLDCKDSECKEKNLCLLCNKYLTALEDAIIFTGIISSSYSAEELYKEAYKAMVIFYKHAPYSYKSKDKKDTGKIIEMAGKDVIVEQVCMKCEARIAKKGTGPKTPYRMVTSPQYTAMPHHWDISTKIYDHYHIQFVDNSLHTLRRVCLPFFKTQTNPNPIDVHTISDIIEYLESIYNIKETDKIYALAIEENSSTWRFLTDEQKTHTMKYLKEIEKLSVVFYYIKEGLEDKPFTLSVFKRADSEEKDTQQIPVFLSPFMECAMQQLRLYKKERGYNSAENQKSLLEGDGIKPCVYEYTKSDNDKTTYSQIQLYYSAFYIDENMKEHRELCPILFTSQEEIENTNKETNKEEEKEYKMTWYVRAPEQNPQEYTHYYFDKENESGDRAGQSTISKILTSLRKKSRTTSNPVYVFYIAESTKIPYQIFFFQQKDKKINEKFIRTEMTLRNYQIIAFKTFNYTKSHIGLHGEIFRELLDITISSDDDEVLS